MLDRCGTSTTQAPLELSRLKQGLPRSIEPTSAVRGTPVAVRSLACGARVMTYGVRTRASPFAKEQGSRALVRARTAQQPSRTRAVTARSTQKNASKNVFPLPRSMFLEYTAPSDQLQTVGEAACQQPASFVHVRPVATTTRFFCMAELSRYACIAETRSDHPHGLNTTLSLMHHRLAIT